MIYDKTRRFAIITLKALTMPNDDMFTIYYDSLTEATWFQDLSNRLSNASLKLIGERERNPHFIEELIKYDRPDIILTHHEEPVLVLEKTTEVPTGHNVGQRFARLVRAVEHGILTLYYFPYDARKHGKYTSMCNLNIRLIQACLKIESIHKTPLLTINWLTDNSGELITDGTEDRRVAEIVEDFIKTGFNNYCPEVEKQIEDMKNEYNKRLKIRASYGGFPPSVLCYKTQDFLRTNSIKHCDNDFLKRPYTYVYIMDMSVAKCKRQDPYTGTQFIYDYIVCRKGKKPSEKKNNLVLNFPSISQKEWFRNNPNDPKTKSCNWYLTANALLFKDGIFFNKLN